MDFAKFFDALGFFLTANAGDTSYSTNVINTDCKERSCLYGSVGIGGAYYNLNNSDMLSQAYYLYLGGKYVWNTQAQFKPEVRIGVGKNTLKGDFPTTLRVNEDYLYYDIKLKGGWNILSKDYPLFLNVFGEVVSQTPKKSFGRAHTVVGLELEGSAPVGENLKLTYGVGYGWLYGAYFYERERARVPNSASNFEINANVGINYEFGNGYAYFARIIGKYQKIGASHTITYQNAPVSYPASNNYAGMLEMGIEF